MCVCACARACVCVCVHACVRARVCVKVACDAVWSAALGGSGGSRSALCGPVPVPDRSPCPVFMRVAGDKLAVVA